MELGLEDKKEVVSALLGGRELSDKDVRHIYFWYRLSNENFTDLKDDSTGRMKKEVYDSIIEQTKSPGDFGGVEFASFGEHSPNKPEIKERVLRVRGGTNLALDLKLNETTTSLGGLEVVLETSEHPECLFLAINFIKNIAYANPELKEFLESKGIEYRPLCETGTNYRPYDGTILDVQLVNNFDF